MNPLRRILLVSAWALAGLLSSATQAATVVKPAAPAPAQSAVEKRLDSLIQEIRVMQRILAGKGIDFEREKRQLALEDSTFDIRVDGLSLLGPAKAPVTLVAFVDLQCPYCARLTPVLQMLHERYPTQLRIAMRHYPLSFHERAMPSHQALCAAGRQGKFWEYYFQVGEGSEKALSDSGLIASATRTGLDLARFNGDRASTACADEIARDQKVAEGLGVRGTPTMYVNGRMSRNPVVDVAKALGETPAAR